MAKNWQHPLATSSAAVLFLLAPSSPAQTTVLDEDFNGAQFPPPMWSEQNNGVSVGWEHRDPGEAFHADFFGANDNRLIGPAMDLSGLTEVALHGQHGQLFAIYRDRNEIEVSLDGGLTFQWVHSISDPGDGLGLALEVDLGAYAGAGSVNLSFRYVGDYANEWSMDWVVVDDQPAQIPAHWPNLPTAFVTMDGYCERFDGLAAGLPAHMASNSVDEESRQADSDGWCNFGQQAACIHSYSGLSALEMGLNPATTNYHQIANSIIIGLDGSGASNWDLEMRVLQMGEELNADDGLFVSLDGESWIPVISNWTHMTGGVSKVGKWQKVTCDLGTVNADLSGQFYLAVCQADDFPYNSQDGVVIDDLCIGGDVVALRFSIAGLVAGELARLEVTGLDPLAFTTILVSLIGPGPTQTLYGTADVGYPYHTLAYVDANTAGEVRIQAPVPPWTSGMMVWGQAVEIVNFETRFSNAIAEAVQ
ncbi:MAG: hypothetical protein HQ519_03800 [Planctomycetes bacterium]|nr:hypothetical protein [Planctomycetota bacterium]